jgi:hypothetical protein
MRISAERRGPGGRAIPPGSRTYGLSLLTTHPRAVVLFHDVNALPLMDYKYVVAGTGSASAARAQPIDG